MALIVEDGSIVSGANSYVSAADTTTYLTLRDIETAVSDGQLVRGADYVNAFRKLFKGYKLTATDSSMQWPRSYVEIDGFLLPDDKIPQCVKDAQIQVALEIALDRDPHITQPQRPIKKEKLDVLEVEYDTTASPYESVYKYQKIRALLLPVLIDMYGRTSR